MITKRDLQSCLIGKFGFSQSEGGNHETFTYSIEGRKIATTRFSRGWRKNKPIPKPILSKMANQLWVNTATLKEMEGCTVGVDDYHDILRQQNKI